MSAHFKNKERINYLNLLRQENQKLNHLFSFLISANWIQSLVKVQSALINVHLSNLEFVQRSTELVAVLGLINERGRSTVHLKIGTFGILL